MRRIGHQLRAPFQHRVLILLYHNVGSVSSDPWSLFVSPENFAEQMDCLRRYADPISLTELVLSLGDHRLPRRAVVITFDDGYAGTLHIAKPLLSRFHVPATLFVASGRINRGTEFWSDELDRMLLQPGILPDSLEVTVEERLYRWDLRTAARYTDGDRVRSRKWRAWERHRPTARHEVYRALYDLLLPLSESSREEILQSLRQWANAKPAVRETHRPLTRVELQQLAADDSVNIGAHSVSHPQLAGLDHIRQREEIGGSKRWLEEAVGRSVTDFAYPFGGESDFTNETVNIVKEAGFASGFASLPGSVTDDSDVFRLPRVHVHDWNRDEFREKLQGWLAG